MKIYSIYAHQLRAGDVVERDFTGDREAHVGRTVRSVSYAGTSGVSGASLRRVEFENDSFVIAREDALWDVDR